MIIIIELKSYLGTGSKLKTELSCTFEDAENISGKKGRSNSNKEGTEIEMNIQSEFKCINNYHKNSI